MKEQGKNLFAILGGAICVTYPVLNLLRQFVNSQRYGYGFHMTFARAIFLLAFVALGVLLLIRKKHIGFVIVGGVLSLAGILWWFQDIGSLIRFFDAYSVLYMLRDMLEMLAYMALTALAVLNCIPALRRAAGITKVLWFIPAALVMLGWFLTMVTGLRRSTILAGLFTFFMYALSAGGLVLCGLWFASFLDRAPAQTSLRQTAEPAYYGEPQRQTYTPTQAAPAPASPASDVRTELIAMKELMEQGLISEEEYEAKKKQILGL